MSHRPALQSRHLRQRAERGGRSHQHRPAEQSQPEAAREVVGGELRRQPVEGVRQPGAERDGEARAAGRAAQAEREQRESRENADGRPQARPLRVRRVARGRGEGEQRHARADGERGEALPAADPLAELPRRDAEQEDEARAEQRLHERQRRLRQGVRLDDPAEQAERRPRDPARPPHEAGEE